MIDAYLASPTPVGDFIPDTIPDPFPGLSQQWKGWNGTTFDLYGDSGVVLVNSGLRGLSAVETKGRVSAHPLQHGQRFKSWRAEPRDVHWNVLVWTDKSSEDWLLHEREFWATLHPGKTGVWSVTTPDNQTRYLNLRFTGDGGHAYDYDPVFRGFETYGLDFVADSPFWMGEKIVRAFAQPSQKNFFGGGAIDGKGKGTPLFISAASTLASATMPNPGELEAYPVWEIYPPFTGFSVRVDGHEIRGGAPSNADYGYRVLTAPDQQTIEICSVSKDAHDQPVMTKVSESLAGFTKLDFAPVAAGGESSIQIEIDGGGFALGSITPQFFRAW